MKRSTARWFGGMALSAALVGCSSKGSMAVTAQTPLTIDDWKQLPPAQKYEVPTLERLKQGEPKLNDPREWDKFTRTILLPSKQKELPQR